MLAVDRGAPALIGGESGIRTRDTGLPYTRFPGVLLQPLGHLSLQPHCKQPKIIDENRLPGKVNLADKCGL